MPLINGLIPESGFEAVRYRICEILADELPRQYELNYNDEDIDISEIWMERIWGFDPEDLPAVNVAWSGGDLDNHHMGSTDNTSRYVIEVYTKAAETAPDSGLIRDNTGDALAKVACSRILGIVRGILESPVYKTLAFEPNFIMSRRAVRMEPIAVDGGGAKNIVAGRLILEVRLHESADLIVPNSINGFKTTVTMEETSKGYLFIQY